MYNTSEIIVGRLSTYTGSKPLHSGYKLLLSQCIHMYSKGEIKGDDEFEGFVEKCIEVREREEGFRKERKERGWKHQFEVQGKGKVCFVRIIKLLKNR